jgi:hypothetical protein
LTAQRLRIAGERQVTDIKRSHQIACRFVRTRCTAGFAKTASFGGTAPVAVGQHLRSGPSRTSAVGRRRDVAEWQLCGTLLWIGPKAIAQAASQCIERHAVLRPVLNTCAQFKAAVMSESIPVIDLAPNAAVRAAGKTLYDERHATCKTQRKNCGQGCHP